MEFVITDPVPTARVSPQTSQTAVEGNNEPKNNENIVERTLTPQETLLINMARNLEDNTRALTILAQSIEFEQQQKKKRDESTEVKISDSEVIEDTFKVLSVAEQCDLCVDHSSYIFAKFSSVKDERVNACLSHILRDATVKCGILYDDATENSDLPILTTYQLAVGIHECYYPRPISCIHPEMKQLMACIETYTLFQRISFFDKIGEVSDICCHLRHLNFSNLAVAEKVHSMYQGILKSNFLSKMEHVFSTAKAVPESMCKLGPAWRFMISQFSLIPACLDPKSFVSQEMFVLFSLTTISSMIAYWPRSPNETPEAKKERFENIGWPSYFLAGWELALSYFFSLFNLPFSFRHIIIILLRYQTLISVIIGQRPHVLEGVKSFIGIINNFLPWISESLMDEIRSSETFVSGQQASYPSYPSAATASSQMLSLPATPKTTRNRKNLVKSSAKTR